MATLGLAQVHANILRCGIASWKVKWGIGETADDAYYSLGPLADSSVKIEVLGDMPGEYGENRPAWCRLTASAKMLGTHKTTVLELMHNLVNAQLAHKITAVNGTHTFKGNFGMHVKFDASQSWKGKRFIELTAVHHFLLSHASLEDLDEVLAAPAADGTPDVGDVLYTWSAVGEYPAGITGITINPAGDTESPGKYKNASFVAESIDVEDEELGRNLCNGGIRLTGSFDMLQTKTEALHLDSLSNSTNCVMTLADGAAITLTGNMYPLPVFDMTGNAEKEARITYPITKVIDVTEWAGIVS